MAPRGSPKNPFYFSTNPYTRTKDLLFPHSGKNEAIRFMIWPQLLLGGIIMLFGLSFDSPFRNFMLAAGFFAIYISDRMYLEKHEAAGHATKAREALMIAILAAGFNSLCVGMLYIASHMITGIGLIDFIIGIPLLIISLMILCVYVITMGIQFVFPIVAVWHFIFSPGAHEPWDI